MLGPIPKCHFSKMSGVFPFILLVMKSTKHSNWGEHISFKIRNTSGIIFNPIRIKKIKLHCFLFITRDQQHPKMEYVGGGKVVLHNFGKVLILPRMGQTRVAVLQGGSGLMRSHEKA